MTENPISTALSTVASELQGTIADVLPVAGGVLAVLLGISIGIKLFKRVTGARS